MIVLALVAAACGGLVRLPPGPDRDHGGEAPVDSGSCQPGRSPSAGAACCLLTVPGHVVVLGVCCWQRPAGPGGCGSVGRGGAQQAAEAARIEEACEHLAAELAPGSHPEPP